MPTGKELQRRIKSAKGTRKITKAMQLVSAAKLKKSQDSALSSRRFQAEIDKLLSEVFASLKDVPHSPLLSPHTDAHKTLVVVLSSNKGLVGSLNSNLIKRYMHFVESSTTQKIEVVTVGLKARDSIKRIGRSEIIADFKKPDNNLDISQTHALYSFIVQKFTSGDYSEVYILHNYFHSAMVQKPEVIKLLPFSPVVHAPGADTLLKTTDYIFEPSRSEILTHLIPQAIENRIFQSLLEHQASEQAARMVVMKNATDASTELIDELTLSFNQLRQSRITTELLEITSGKAALEQ